MIPREILKKIRQIELRTNRLVNETLGGQYHSVFKGQGMNFEEVREYQPGDEVRTIDWNVTARMNHPFVKKFVEERELTVVLLVDVSGSMNFGSGQGSGSGGEEQPEDTKRGLAALIGSVLAFSAIRNNDKVGLILFTDEIELYIPPKKGRRHVLRVIREILYFQPGRRGTDLNAALEFFNRVTVHRAVAVVISDFLASEPPPRSQGAPPTGRASLPVTVVGEVSSRLRQTHRRHDVVVVQIDDLRELELPAVGRLVLQDAETGEWLELDTSSARRREMFARRQLERQVELDRHFATLGIDTLRLRTGEPYGVALTRFFETREKRRRR